MASIVVDMSSFPISHFGCQIEEVKGGKSTLPGQTYSQRTARIFAIRLVGERMGVCHLLLNARWLSVY
jgi:hypothetical protein